MDDTQFTNMYKTYGYIYIREVVIVIVIVIFVVWFYGLEIDIYIFTEDGMSVFFALSLLQAYLLTLMLGVA